MPNGHLSLYEAIIAPGGREVARDVNLDLYAGQILAILGPNGRGKTTLIKAMVGALALSAGERIVDGVVGYVPQGDGLGFDYRVREVVVMGRARHLGPF